MKVLLIDDHELFRSGLHLLLQRLNNGQAEIFEAATAESGLHIVKTHQDLQLLLLDINLPDMCGLATVKTFRQACSGASLVLLSGVEDAVFARRCLSEGVQGFIHKSVNPEIFFISLSQILQGETVCLPARCSISTPAVFEIETKFRLTERQQEVLATLCQGLSNKEIARQLNISDNTVRIHIAAILNALGAKTRAEAIVIAQKLGLLA